MRLSIIRGMSKSFLLDLIIDRHGTVVDVSKEILLSVVIVKYRLRNIMYPLLSICTYRSK